MLYPEWFSDVKILYNKIYAGKIASLNPQINLINRVIGIPNQIVGTQKLSGLYERRTHNLLPAKVGHTGFEPVTPSLSS
jgi:hypothetical protein